MLDGPHFIFPGGGTMFPDGAIQYIEKLGQYIPISDGVLRTALDMGCGVKSVFLFSGDLSSYHFKYYNWFLYRLLVLVGIFCPKTL